MTTIDPERQRQAKEYARISRRLWLVDSTFTAVYALAWLFFGWTILLRNWLDGFSPNQWLLVPLFVLVYGGIYFVLNLPLGYYEGFVLPQPIDQSTLFIKDWVMYQLKGMQD